MTGTPVPGTLANFLGRPTPEVLERVRQMLLVWALITELTPPEDLNAYRFVMKEQGVWLAWESANLEARAHQVDLANRRLHTGKSTNLRGSKSNAPTSYHHRSRRDHATNSMKRDQRVNHNLESSFMTTNPYGYQVYNTLTTNMIITTAYLENTQPPEDDPKAELHQKAMAVVNASIALEANWLPPPKNHLAASHHTTLTTISSWRQDDPPPRYRDSLPHRETPPRRQRNSPSHREYPPHDARDDLFQDWVD